MVVVMIVAYLVGWTPYAAFSIIVTACPTIYLDPRLAAAPAFFSKTAAVYNPVIYVFMNKQVSHSFPLNAWLLMTFSGLLITLKAYTVWICDIAVIIVVQGFRQPFPGVL